MKLNPTAKPKRYFLDSFWSHRFWDKIFQLKRLPKRGKEFDITYIIKAKSKLGSCLHFNLYLPFICFSPTLPIVVGFYNIQYLFFNIALLLFSFATGITKKREAVFLQIVLVISLWLYTLFEFTRSIWNNDGINKKLKIFEYIFGYSDFTMYDLRLWLYGVLLLLYLIILYLSFLILKTEFILFKSLPSKSRDIWHLPKTKKVNYLQGFYHSKRKTSIVFSAFHSAACLIPVFLLFLALLLMISLDHREMDMIFPLSTFGWIIVILWLVLVIIGSWGATYFITKAKRLAAMSVSEVRKLDNRPPILLIRSFLDDITPVSATEYLMMASNNSSKYYSKALTIEDVIGQALDIYGPVIAIGRPGEKLPPTGAAKEYVSSKKWHGRVEEYIDEAQMVVSIPGKTEGLHLEYELLVKLKALKKTIIIFPPVSDAELQDRWNKFCDVLYVDSSELKPKDLFNTLVMTFSESGIPHIITCTERSDECYRLALGFGMEHKMRVS